MSTKKKLRPKQITCPYCGAPAILENATRVYGVDCDDLLYVCKNYPACDSYIRTIPGSTQPMGTLANAKLRKLRRETHEIFDQLFLRHYMTKDAAYDWMSFWLSRPRAYTHIGMLDTFACHLVMQKSIEFMVNNAWKCSVATDEAISSEEEEEDDALPDNSLRKECAGCEEDRKYEWYDHPIDQGTTRAG